MWPVSLLLQLLSAARYCFSVERTLERSAWLGTKYDDSYFMIFILYKTFLQKKIQTLPKNSDFTEIFVLYWKFRTLPKIRTPDEQVKNGSIGFSTYIELVKSSSFSCVGAGRTRISPAGWPDTLLSAFFEFHISIKSIHFLAFWYC